jgi:hypothetical protein
MRMANIKRMLRRNSMRRFRSGAHSGRPLVHLDELPGALFHVHVLRSGRIWSQTATLRVRMRDDRADDADARRRVLIHSRVPLQDDEHTLSAELREPLSGLPHLCHICFSVHSFLHRILHYSHSAQATSQKRLIQKSISIDPVAIERHLRHTHFF